MKNKGVAMMVLALGVILFSSPQVQNNPLPVDMLLVCECDFQCPSCEDVDFYVKNNSSYTAYFPEDPPWEIWNEDQTQLIFDPIALHVITPLHPSETFPFSWDQRDKDGNLVPLGTYLCKVPYYEEDMQTMHTLIVEFKIIKCTPVHTDWGILALILILFGGGAFLIKRMSTISAKAG